MNKNQNIKKTLKRLSLILFCSILIFTMSGCLKQKKQSPTATMTPEEKAIYERDFTKNSRMKLLNETYPGKTFVIEDVESINDPLNPAYGMNTVKITCVEDGITFVSDPTSGVEEYQEKVWDIGFKKALNETLTTFYADSYLINNSAISAFIAYGFHNDTPEEEDDNKWINGFRGDSISERYFNTSYDEAMTMLANQDVVDPSYVTIAYYVFTDSVDKEKEMDIIRELYKQFVLPIEDETLTQSDGVEKFVHHKRKYVFRIIYLDPSQREIVERYESLNATEDERREYHDAVDNCINKFFHTSHNDTKIITEEDLTDEYLIKYFEK